MCTKNEVPTFNGSKVIIWTDTQTDGQTDTHTDRQTRLKLLPTAYVDGNKYIVTQLHGTFKHKITLLHSNVSLVTRHHFIYLSNSLFPTSVNSTIELWPTICSLWHLKKDIVNVKGCPMVLDGPRSLTEEPLSVFSGSALASIYKRSRSNVPYVLIPIDQHAKVQPVHSNSMRCETMSYIWLANLKWLQM